MIPKLTRVRLTADALTRMPELTRFTGGTVECDLGEGAVEILWDGTDRVKWMKAADVEVVE